MYLGALNQAGQITLNFVRLATYRFMMQFPPSCHRGVYSSTLQSLSLRVSDTYTQIYPFAISGRLWAYCHLFAFMLLQELGGMTCLRSSQGVLLALGIEYRLMSHNPVPSPRGLFWCYDSSSLHSFYLAVRRGFIMVLMYLFLFPVSSFCRTSVSMLNLEF